MTFEFKHMVIILAVVALFAMLVMAPANVEYLSIVAERSNVANSVNTGMVDFGTLEASYQRCIDRMKALEGKSDYGHLLASIDKMSAGKLVIAVLILSQSFIVLMASFLICAYVVLSTIKMLRKLRRKIRRAKMRKKRNAAKKQTVKPRSVSQKVV